MVDILDRFSIFGKTAIVTGAGSGIGKATAIAFGQAGANVLVAGIDVENNSNSLSQLEITAKEIEKFGVKSLTVVGDVRMSDQVENIVYQSKKKFKSIDVLANIVGGMFPIKFENLSENGFDAVLRVNMKTVFLCTQAVSKIMIEQGTGGSIINVASISALRPSQMTPHYTAAKAGVIGLTMSTAYSLSSYNIRVNAVAPGGVKTPGRNRTNMDLSVSPSNPMLSRDADPEEIASTILFLASPASSFINGITIVADGGKHMLNG